MSDSRFRLKVVFEIYGQEFHWQPSLNWSAEQGECDERVARWFAECADKAYIDFHEAQRREDEKHRAKQIEAQERAELVRLTAKYGAPQQEGG